jgi:hypothetical protein
MYFMPGRVLIELLLFKKIEKITINTQDNDKWLEYSTQHNVMLSVAFLLLF